MKLQAFDSKRRLTNICCFVVGLGLVKLVFGAYILAGGTLFSFESVKHPADPKAEALAKAREQQRLALKKANQEIIVSQKIDTPADSQVSDSATQSSENKTIAAINNQNKAKARYLADNADGVKADMLVQASMATIGAKQSQTRHALLESSIQEPSEEAKKELNESLETAKPNYKQEKTFSFSLVGTAHAEEPNTGEYLRPDQRQTTTMIPTPKVEKPYDSPDVLSYKEAELNQKEEELLSLQEQMNSRMQELNQLENKLGNMVQEANSVEDTKYTHLIATYAAMKPRKAAEALSTLDEKIAVRILNGMKSKQSGEIFSYMDPLQAARLSKAMTKLQTN